MDPQRFHPPRQARSRETLDRILDAAEEVMERKSFSEATLAEIVERAGVTVGAFYRRFPDKDALLHLLDDRFWADLRRAAAELLDPARWEGRPAREIVEAWVALVAKFYRARRGLCRTLVQRSRTDPVVRETAACVNAFVVGRLRVLLLARRDEIHHPDPGYAIELAVVMVLGTLREALLFGDAWPDARAVSGDRLAGEVARACLGYLGADEGARRPVTLRRASSA